MGAARRTRPLAVQLAVPKPFMYVHAHACEVCGALTTRSWLCSDCTDKARAHVDGDPYDDLGGEGGPGS